MGYIVKCLIYICSILSLVILSNFTFFLCFLCFYRFLKKRNRIRKLENKRVTLGLRHSVTAIKRIGLVIERPSQGMSAACTHAQGEVGSSANRGSIAGVRLSAQHCDQVHPCAGRQCGG